MAHILLSRSILDHQVIYDTCMKYLKKGDKVLILLYSFFGNQLKDQQDYDAYYKEGGAYDLKMRGMFALYDIFDVIYLDYYKDDEKMRVKKIAEANILYFPGGAPDEMMIRLKAHALISHIKQFIGHTIGSSAGAMIHLDTYHIYKDKQYKAFQYKEGLGLIHGFDICVHYKRKIQQHKAINKVRREKHLDIFVLPDDGAMIIDGGKVCTIHSARQFSNAKGKLS